MKQIEIKVLAIIVLCFFCIMAHSDPVDYDISSDGTYITITNIRNTKNYEVEVYVDNTNYCCGNIRPNGSLPLNKKCTIFVLLMSTEKTNIDTIFKAAPVLESYRNEHKSTKTASDEKVQVSGLTADVEKKSVVTKQQYSFDRNEEKTLKNNNNDTSNNDFVSTDTVQNYDDDSFNNDLHSVFVTNSKSILLIVGIALVLIFLIIIILIKVRQKSSSKKPTVFPIDDTQQNAHAEIVVRRKTTSILKKQSLEDVVNNPSYLNIDCADFCDDSAVRKIYIKNTCIKDVYNMYADDLRNPDNPNEDGCMVLGRWVNDKETDEYYVSLEEIVKPGDDAVFTEYELNFGGKIKLKVAEALRRLRKETNMQYDMTCWVHSHPGLGVFFSNADSSVQMQLKHPTHPKFLTAIVVDILTPEQELGIFTFKHDMSINSRPELKKMYSLEEMYRWAMASDRNSFKPEDYYDIMQATQERLKTCFGVYIANSVIIDMCQMEAEQQIGLVGWINGFANNKGANTEYVAKTVSKSDTTFRNDTIGCFIIGTHRSIPTIRKTITDADSIQFVLFYSTTDGLLTTIPVVDGQLVVEEKNYGEEKLEALKIWTRRKR